MMQKPMGSPANIDARKEFALNNFQRTNQWRQINFSDEKRFNLNGPDGFAYHWHDLRTEENNFRKRQSAHINDSW